MKNRVKVILQARTGSSRLYGKVLLPVLNEPLIVLCWKRLIQTKLDITVVIPEGNEDDHLFSILKKNGISVYRGDKLNVLKRFKSFTKNFNKDDILIRVTGDNPLVDGFFLRKILKIYNKNKLDYFSAKDNINFIPTGIQAEIFRVKHLREAKGNYEYSKEHVTPEIRSKYLLSKFKVSFLDFEKFSKTKLTIDYLDDFKKLNQIFNYSKNSKYSDLVKILKNFKKNKIYKISKTKPSKLILGTVQLGKKYFNNESKITFLRAKKIINTALKNKINFFDTAYDYGKSEKFIGENLKNKDNYICSKLKNIKFKKKLNQQAIINEVNKSIFTSLKDLQRFYIDYYLIHNSENLYKSKIIYNHLVRLLKCGIIKNLGVSIYSPNEFYKIKDYKHISSVQMPFNILDYRWINILKKKHKLTIFVRSIFLRGNIKKNRITFDNKTKYQKHLIKNLIYLSRKFKRKNLVDMSLSYVKSFRNIDYFVIGVKNQAHLLDLVNLFKMKSLNRYSNQEIISVAKKYFQSKNADLRKWNS